MLRYLGFPPLNRSKKIELWGFLSAVTYLFWPSPKRSSSSLFYIDPPPPPAGLNSQHKSEEFNVSLVQTCLTAHLQFVLWLCTPVPSATWGTEILKQVSCVDPLDSDGITERMPAQRIFCHLGTLSISFIPYNLQARKFRRDLGAPELPALIRIYLVYFTA